jgi:hypothetical protein
MRIVDHNREIGDIDMLDHRGRLVCYLHNPPSRHSIRNLFDFYYRIGELAKGIEDTVVSRLKRNDESRS